MFSLPRTAPIRVFGMYATITSTSISRKFNKQQKWMLVNYLVTYLPLRKCLIHKNLEVLSEQSTWRFQIKPYLPTLRNRFLSLSTTLHVGWPPISLLLKHASWSGISWKRLYKVQSKKWKRRNDTYRLGQNHPRPHPHPHPRQFPRGRRYLMPQKSPVQYHPPHHIVEQGHHRRLRCLYQELLDEVMTRKEGCWHSDLCWIYQAQPFLIWL